MITITDIRYARGHSGEDHLLSDGELYGLIGGQYRTLDHALVAARKRATGLGQSTPIVIEGAFANGQTVCKTMW